MKDFIYEDKQDWRELDQSIKDQPVNLVVPAGAACCLHRP